MNFPTRNQLEKFTHIQVVNKYCFLQFKNGGHLGFVKYGLNYLKDPRNELLDSK